MVTIEWSTSRFAIRLLADEGPVRLVDLTSQPTFDSPFDPARYAKAHQPLVEIMSPLYGSDTTSNSNRYSGTHLGRRCGTSRHDESTERRRRSARGRAGRPRDGLDAAERLRGAVRGTRGPHEHDRLGRRRAHPAGRLGGHQLRHRRRRLRLAERPRRLARPTRPGRPRTAGPRSRSAPRGSRGPSRRPAARRSAAASARRHQHLVVGGPTSRPAPCGTGAPGTPWPGRSSTTAPGCGRWASGPARPAA